MDTQLLKRSLPRGYVKQTVEDLGISRIWLSKMVNGHVKMDLKVAEYLTRMIEKRNVEMKIIEQRLESACK